MYAEYHYRVGSGSLPVASITSTTTLVVYFI